MFAGVARGGHGKPQTEPSAEGLGEGSSSHGVMEVKCIRWVGRKDHDMEELWTEGVCIINPSFTEEETWTKEAVI